MATVLNYEGLPGSVLAKKDVIHRTGHIIKMKKEKRIQVKNSGKSECAL